MESGKQKKDPGIDERPEREASSRIRWGVVTYNERVYTANDRTNTILI